MQSNVILHTWFRIAKAVRIKYGITTNTIIVLNAAYLLYMTNNKSFTRGKLRLFTRYWSQPKLDAYIKILIDKEFIYVSGSYTNHLLYSLTEKGLSAIKDLNNSFDSVVYDFCNKYNIVL